MVTSCRKVTRVFCILFIEVSRNLMDNWARCREDSHCLNTCAICLYGIWPTNRQPGLSRHEYTDSIGDRLDTGKERDGHTSNPVDWRDW